MNTNKSARSMMGAFAVGIAALAPAAVNAQAAPIDDRWKWGVTLYGWFPGIDGSTNFPAPGGSPSINVDAGDIISALDFAFMGTIEGRKGKWGFLTDFVYSNVGANESAVRSVTVGPAQRPVSASADLNLDVKAMFWTIAGIYNLAASPTLTADLVFGARMADMSQELGWTFTGSIADQPGLQRTGSSKVDIQNWDAIIGVRGRFIFGNERKWFVPYHLDIGTGESDFTWQGVVGIGYQFKWGDLGMTWRYLDYQMKSGKPIDSISLSGPAIGVAFRF